MAIRAAQQARRTETNEVDVREPSDGDVELDIRDDDIAELWEHRGALRELSRRIVGDTATAEDVVQDTYLRALRHLGRMERRPSLMPWLTTVAKRRSIDMIRDRRRLSVVDEVPDTPARAEFDPLVRALAGDTVERVRSALATLNDRERRLLSLQVDGGMSLEELADEDGATVDSVRSVLARARSKLKDALAETAAPAAFTLPGLLAAARRRIDALGARFQQSSPIAAPAFERLSELVAAGVAVAVLGAAPTVPTAASSVDRASDGAPSASLAADAAAADTGAGGAGNGPSGPAGPGGVTAAPSPSGVRALAPAVPAGLVPGEEPPAGPHEAGIEGFAAGTGSGGSPVLLAAGTRLRGCTTDCFVLFRSDDGGRTWQRLSAAGMTGTVLAVAPGFPADPRIVASGRGGVSISHDGGATFEPVIGPGPGASVAVSPGFSAGDDRVLVGSSPAWVYDDRSGAAAPFAGAPSVGTATHFAFAPDYRSSGRLFATALGATTADGTTASLYRCTARAGHDVCDERVDLPGLTDVSGVVSPSSPSLAGVVVVWGPGGALASRDGGITFRAASVPGGLAVDRVVDSGDGVLYAAAPGSAQPGAGGVLRSGDGGNSWSLLGAGTSLTGGTGAVAALPGGRVVAAPLAAAGGGLWCSNDGGLTWEARCAR